MPHPLSALDALVPDTVDYPFAAWPRISSTVCPAVSVLLVLSLPASCLSACISAVYLASAALAAARMFSCFRLSRLYRSVSVSVITPFRTSFVRCFSTVIRTQVWYVQPLISSHRPSCRPSIGIVRPSRLSSRYVCSIHLALTAPPPPFLQKARTSYGT